MRHKKSITRQLSPQSQLSLSQGSRNHSLELSPDEASNIRAWLAHIEESDPVIIAEVVDKCHYDLAARRYFLKRSEEVPEAITINHPMTCGGCVHFEWIDHPRLGHCAKGKPEAIAGLWDTDQRYCERFIPQPRSKP